MKSKISRKRPAIITIIVFINFIGWIATEGVCVYFHLSGQIPEISSAKTYWEQA